MPGAKDLKEASNGELAEARGLRLTRARLWTIELPAKNLIEEAKKKEKDALLNEATLKNLEGVSRLEALNNQRQRNLLKKIDDYANKLGNPDFTDFANGDAEKIVKYTKRTIEDTAKKMSNLDPKAMEYLHVDTVMRVLNNLANAQANPEVSNNTIDNDNTYPKEQRDRIVAVVAAMFGAYNMVKLGELGNKAAKLYLDYAKSNKLDGDLEDRAKADAKKLDAVEKQVQQECEAWRFDTSGAKV